MGNPVIDEMKAKSFALYKEMCIRHLQEDLKHIEECENFNELAKHLYGVYRIFAMHSKTAYDHAEDKEYVKKNWMALEQMFKISENGRNGL